MARKRAACLHSSICLLMGSLLAALCTGCGRKNTSGAAEPQPPALAAHCDAPVGNADAPVHIQAFLPVNNGCQDSLGLYLVGIAQKNPDIFRVEVIDMKSQNGSAMMAQCGIRCAAVRINGETAFDLPAPTGKVLLEGPMDPRDVRSALVETLKGRKLELAHELPHPVVPEGFAKDGSWKKARGSKAVGGGQP